MHKDIYYAVEVHISWAFIGNYAQQLLPGIILEKEILF